MEESGVHMGDCYKPRDPYGWWCYDPPDFGIGGLWGIMGSP